jgi:hypothetical protein
MFTLKSTPQSFQPLIKDAYRLFAFSAIKMLPLAALSLALMSLPFFALLLLPDASTENATEWVTYIAILLIFTVWPALMSGVLYGTHNVSHGQRVDYFACVYRAAVTFVPAAICGVLFALVTAVGLVCLVVPGVFVFYALCLWWPAMVIDKQGIFSALETSHKLVQGHWWRTAAVVSVMMGLILAASKLFDWAHSFLPEGDLLSLSAMNITGSLFLSLVFFTIFSVSFSAFSLVLFNDLKLRVAALQTTK